MHSFMAFDFLKKMHNVLHIAIIQYVRTEEY